MKLRNNVVIVVTVAISALRFLATGGTDIPSDISPTIEKSTAPIKEASKETVEKFTELSESISKIIVKMSEKTKQIAEQIKEAKSNC